MTAFNKQLPRPAWLDNEYDQPNTVRGQRFYRHLWNAQPSWADHRHIRRIYAKAKEMSRHGVQYEVDHIIPLQHPLVCGLHVPWNLRIERKETNMWKSNDRWPGHPQQELFFESHACPLFELEFSDA